jgi:hypothetical protein
MMRAVRTTIATLVLVPSALVLVGPSGAAFPGANGKIAWASARTGNFEIYSASPDGTGLARLTSDPATDKDPAWSPDGTRIVFQSNRSGNDDVYVMNADGTAETRLTTSPASDVNPSWGPASTRSIVFSSNRDGDAEIFVMNEDGSNQTQLTRNDGASDAVPAWSPDGRRIAFTSTRDGHSQIYVMNADGSGQTRLTSDPASDVSPSWSPDGTKIAFASDRDGNYEIYVMDANGTNQHRLTTNLEADLDPAWSPDGTKIAFTSNRDANYEIYLMNADGSAQSRFTASAAEDTTTDWQPVPVSPPPPTAVTGARLVPRWHESEYRGSLVLTGSVPGPSRLRLVLRRGNAVRFTARVVLTAGAFRRELRLPHDLLPGPYVLDVTAPASPTLLTPQVLSPTLRPPPEGVVSRAWLSDVVGGPPVTRFPSTTTRVWAQFRFATLPRSGRRITATWSGPSTVTTTPKPRTVLVVSYVDSTNGVPLYRGSWSCVLRAGGAIVKRVGFRIG